jgi:hypothetical protein
MKNKQIHITINEISKNRTVVDRILCEAAKKYQLFDNTATSKVPNTIRSLVEREHYGFGLGARIVNELIVVDFFPHKRPSSVFNDVCKFVVDNIFLAFPNNSEEAKESAFINLYH